MRDSCRTLRLAMENMEAPDAAAKAHLAGCPACRAHARLLAELTGLEPGEADETTCRAVLASLPMAPWQRRRAVTWLPAVAGLLLLGVGLALLGGPPAPQAVASVPGALGSLAGWLASWTLDALTVAQGTSDAARALLTTTGVWLLAWLSLVLLGGGWALAGLTRRSRSR